MSDLLANRMVQIVLVVAAVLIVGYLILNYMKNPSRENFAAMHQQVRKPSHMPVMHHVEKFTDSPNDEYMVHAGEPINMSEQPKALGNDEGAQVNQMPAECYPRDLMSSKDLLPNGADNLWSKVSPGGQGSLGDQNFLNAGYHVGINTVGQTLRNPNYQLRSEPPNPQVKVSVWNETTIDPDTGRRAFEINGTA